MGVTRGVLRTCTPTARRGVHRSCTLINEYHPAPSWAGFFFCPRESTPERWSSDGPIPRTRWGAAGLTKGDLTPRALDSLTAGPVRRNLEFWRCGKVGKVSARRADLIVRDPSICHGQAVVKGTRVMVSVILDALAEGMTEAEITAEYPTLTPEGIRAAAAYGARLARDEAPVPRDDI